MVPLTDKYSHSLLQIQTQPDKGGLHACVKTFKGQHFWMLKMFSASMLKCKPLIPWPWHCLLLIG